MSAPEPSEPSVDRGGHLWHKDREATSADGTTVRYTVLGESGPWVALLPGFMCPDNFWAGLAPRLAEHHRVVVLNYRGIGASEQPTEAGFAGLGLNASDYTIPKFAEDVAAVIDAEDASGVSVIGHSMGCQVSLATWRLLGGERIASMTLVTGMHQSPFKTFYGLDLRFVVPLLYAGAHLTARPVQKAFVKLTRLPIAMQVARLTRALGPHTPDHGMDLYFDHFPEVDPLITIRKLKGMNDYDATPWLGEVDVPTLLMAGTKDTFTPPTLGPLMRDLIPGSELVEIIDGTHGAIIEFPDEIADAILDFWHRRLGHEASAPKGRDGVVIAVDASADTIDEAA